MMINALQTIASLAATLNRPDTPAAATTSSSKNADDQVSISDAARALQKNNDWQTALLNRKDGLSKLAALESSISGGIDALQKNLGQWLQAQGLDPNAKFSVNYDAASQTFNVKGPANIKNALEKELNVNSSNAFGSAFRQGYSLLQNLTGNFAAARQQAKTDLTSGGADAFAKQQGSGYSFSLDMADGKLHPRLKPLA